MHLIAHLNTQKNMDLSSELSVQALIYEVNSVRCKTVNQRNVL